VAAFVEAPRAVTRHDLAAAGIRVRQTETGVEYHFEAARNPSFAIGLTVFLLIWTGALWLQIALGAPWFFPLLFGRFELLLVVIVADTSSRDWHVEGSGRTRHRENRTAHHHADERPIGDPYYEIRATSGTGRRTSRGSGIRDKAYAEWLAREMRSALGLRA
jgi:hypothetical protein